MNKSDFSDYITNRHGLRSDREVKNADISNLLSIIRSFFGKGWSTTDSRYDAYEPGTYGHVVYTTASFRVRRSGVVLDERCFCARIGKSVELADALFNDPTNTLFSALVSAGKEYGFSLRRDRKVYIFEFIISKSDPKKLNIFNEAPAPQ